MAGERDPLPYSALRDDGDLPVEYGLGSDSHPRDGVPVGSIEQFEWSRSDVYPGTSRTVWVCAVATTVAAVLIAVAPLLQVTIMVLLAVIAGTFVNFAVATTSVVRLTREIRAREYEARFPHAEG